MINKLRARAQSESGFTLVELLVVMLIIGLLAAIAIPAFFNQRDKARDADAKESVRTMETAMETYSTDNDGVYTAADLDALVLIEPTISDAPQGADDATPPVVDVAGPKEYTVTVESKTDNTFTIHRLDTGETDYTCTDEGEGGCPTGSNWD
jgi:type IV pilus assembly protein PilA